MAYKLLVTREIPDKGLNILKEAGFELTVRSDSTPFKYDEFVTAAADFDMLLTTSKEKVDRNFLQTNRHLKVISQFAAGYDNIDIAAASELGIPIGHAPQAMNNATSDIAFGLMIATARNFFQMHKKITEGKLEDFKPKANLGLELTGKTLGVFGLGAIGFDMARKCKAAYGMKIIYTNRSVNSKAETELGAKRVKFIDLLEKSDVISVHSNLSEQTRQIFNYAAFRRMKDKAIFINTSRGAVHHEADLIQALQEGCIWGAGLDVSDPEPMLSSNPLLSMPNVCVLPHIGSATVEARDEMARLAAENIVQFVEKGKMIYCVNSEVLSKQ